MKYRLEFLCGQSRGHSIHNSLPEAVNQSAVEFNRGAHHMKVIEYDTDPANGKVVAIQANDERQLKIL